MGSIKLAIFDLDGTILDTIEDLADALNEALEACGYPPSPLEEVRAHVGNGLRKLIERSVPSLEQDMGETDRILACLVASYQRRCCNKTRPYPGIAEAFAKLQEAGVQVAVVSNKIDSAVRILCETYFPGLIDSCAGEKEGVRKKPAPDAVFAMLERFGAAPEEAVYIGDSEVDIRTAEHAGLRSVIVTWGFRERQFLLEQGAVCLADSAEEMLRQILGRKVRCSEHPESR